MIPAFVVPSCVSCLALLGCVVATLCGTMLNLNPHLWGVDLGSLAMTFTK